MRKVCLEAGQGKVWLVNANFGLGLHLGVAVRKAGKEAGMGKTVLQLWFCVWVAVREAGQIANRDKSC